MKLHDGNQFTARFELDLPLVQGPFGGGLSTVELTAAVSNRGGLGSYGVHHLDGNGILAVATEIRARTARPFALNLWVGDHDPGGDDMSETTFERAWKFYRPWFEAYDLPKPQRPEHYHPRFADQIEALIEARPAAFSFVFGVPDARVLDKCHRAGIVTIGAATTLAEVEALDAAGVTVILVSGFEAGGHRPSFLSRAEDSLMGTATLARLARAVTSRPIVAAGGMADAAGIRAVLAAGADAAQLGTAFLACAESGTAEVHRELLFSPRARTTRLTRAYTGRLARGVPNRVMEEFDRLGPALPPFPIHAWFVGKLKAAGLAANHEDFVSLYAGQAAPLLRHRTAGALIDAIRAEL